MVKAGHNCLIVGKLPENYRSSFFFSSLCCFNLRVLGVVGFIKEVKKKKKEEEEEREISCHKSIISSPIPNIRSFTPLNNLVSKSHGL